MDDDAFLIAAKLIEHGRTKISGPAEWGLVVAGVLIGAGLYKFFSGSSVKAEGPLPPVNINVGKKP